MLPRLNKLSHILFEFSFPFPSFSSFLFFFLDSRNHADHYSALHGYAPVAGKELSETERNRFALSLFSFDLLASKEARPPPPPPPLVRSTAEKEEKPNCLTSFRLLQHFFAFSPLSIALERSISNVGSVQRKRLGIGGSENEDGVLGVVAAAFRRRLRRRSPEPTECRARMAFSLSLPLLHSPFPSRPLQLPPIRTIHRPVPRCSPRVRLFRCRDVERVLQRKREQEKVSSRRCPLLFHQRLFLLLLLSLLGCPPMRQAPLVFCFGVSRL